MAVMAPAAVEEREREGKRGRDVGTCHGEWGADHGAWKTTTVKSVPSTVFWKLSSFNCRTAAPAPATVTASNTQTHNSPSPVAISREKPACRFKKNTLHRGNPMRDLYTLLIPYRAHHRTPAAGCRRRAMSLRGKKGGFGFGGFSVQKTAPQPQLGRAWTKEKTEEEYFNDSSSSEEEGGPESEEAVKERIAREFGWGEGSEAPAQEEEEEEDDDPLDAFMAGIEVSGL